MGMNSRTNHLRAMIKLTAMLQDFTYLFQRAKEPWNQQRCLLKVQAYSEAREAVYRSAEEKDKEDNELFHP